MYTVSFDEGEFTRGLEDIQKINPISYHWKESTGYDTANLYSGFSAQNLQLAIPEAVLTNTSGFLTLQDRPILAAAINAIKELGSVFSKIEDGIAYLKEVWFTETVHIDNNVCVDDVCVTKEQFKQILLNSGATVVPIIPSGGGGTGSETPPPAPIIDASSTPPVEEEIITEPIIIEETPVVPEPVAEETPVVSEPTPIVEEPAPTPPPVETPPPAVETPVTE